MRKPLETANTVETSEPDSEEDGLVGRLSSILALAALALSLGEFVALLAVSIGVRPPVSLVQAAQHIVPPLAVILGAAAVLFWVLDSWNQISQHRAFDPREALNDVAIDDLASLLDRMRPGCLLRLALPAGLVASLAVLLATFFWVAPGSRGLQVISNDTSHICQSNGTVLPFVLELDNSTNTVSVSWSAQPVEQLLGQPWAQIQPSQGTVPKGQRENVKVSANSPVCSTTAARPASAHIGADLMSAQQQMVTKYHVSVTTAASSSQVSVVAFSVVGQPMATPCSTTLHASITSPSNGASYSADQNPISFKGSYSGSCGSGPIPAKEMSWHANSTFLGNGTSISYSLSVGSYTIQFGVQDPISGQTAQASVALTVTQAPTPPVPCPTLGASITSPANGAQVTTTQNPISFSGAFSGNCGSIPTSDMTWTANGTSIGTGTTTSATLAAGSYTIQFTVKDPTSRETASATRSITVIQQSCNVQVSITSPANGAQFTTTQNPISFSGAFGGGCGDAIPNNNMTWTANGTSIGTGTMTSATLAAGSYTITFTVTDPKDNQPASASISITVYACTPLQVSITYPHNLDNFLPDPNMTTHTLQVFGTYSGGCGDSIPTSDISWFNNGTLIGNGTSPTVTLTYGNDTLTFTVTDPVNSAAASTSIQVTVLSP